MYDPEKVFHELERASERHTSTQLLASQMESAGEILLSKFMMDARRDGVVASLCKQAARIRPEWKIHIEAQNDAVSDALKAKLHYRNMEHLADGRRTQESSTRALTR